MIGLGGYESYSFGVSPIPIWTVSWFATEYTMEMESRHQYKSADGNVHKDAMQLMKTDLSSGTYRRYNAVIIYGIGRYSAAIDLERTWKEHRLFFEYHFADFWENRTGG